MDTRMYVCTHKNFTKPESDFYIALQVGASLHEDLGYQRDDEGDHISERNGSLSEMTGLYWVWKNVSCDIVGVCHYRRYFEYDNDFLSAADAERILQEYDIIVPYSKDADGYSVYDHYKQNHRVSDLDETRRIIGEISPDYLKALWSIVNWDEVNKRLG